MGKKRRKEKEKIQTPGEKEAGRQVRTKAGRETQEKTRRENRGKGPPPPAVRSLQLGAPGAGGLLWPTPPEFPWRKRKARGRD